jgi:hypothetical protein
VRSATVERQAVLVIVLVGSPPCVRAVGRIARRAIWPIAVDEGRVPRAGIRRTGRVTTATTAIVLAMAKAARHFPIACHRETITFGR